MNQSAFFCRRFALPAAASLLAGCLAFAASAQPVVSEGSGSRRAALDKMLLKPAPINEILGSTEWIGTAPTLGDISGRPVLVFTWAEWYRPSHQTAMLAKRLVEQNEDLVVIGVHHDEGWEEAATFIDRRKLGFPVLRDTDNSIRELLMVDQDPDAYIIDRAGQLRYADITTDSINTAVSAVLSEAMADAAGLEQRLASERAEADRASRVSRGINAGVGLGARLSVPFTQPTAEQYAAARWPKRNTDNDSNRNRRGQNTGPVSIALPEGAWFNDRKPQAGDGRAKVYYLWHPIAPDTINDLMFRMDALQQRLGRDVDVIGALIPSVDRSRNRRNNNQEPDPIRDLQPTAESIRRYAGNRQLSHFLVGLPGSPLPPLDGNNRRDALATFGTVAVVSTDGILRGMAHFSDFDEFQRALDRVIEVDPGIIARKQAEERFIRGGG